MKIKTIMQQKSFHGNAESYDEWMNALFEELAENELDAEIIEKINPDAERPFASIVRWEIRKSIPESIADEMKLKGETKHCKKCSHFEQTDKRKNSGWCSFKNEETSRKNECCDHYYLMMDLELIQDEEE